MRPTHIEDYLVTVRTGQWFGWSDSKNKIYANLIVHDGGSYQSCYCQFMFDVTNTSTHKIRFAVDHYNNSTYTLGASDRNLTHFAFIKVGDT